MKTRPILPCISVQKKASSWLPNSKLDTGNGNMRIFLSAGEPSGDVHGANLVRALKGRYPGLECVGFGGDKMAAAGCRLIYPLCQLSVMWFARVLAKAPT